MPHDCQFLWWIKVKEWFSKRYKLDTQSVGTTAAVIIVWGVSYYFMVCKKERDKEKGLPCHHWPDEPYINTRFVFA